MSYEKTVWQTGDVITAAKLNKIEDALAEMLNGTAENENEPTSPELTPALDGGSK